LVVDFVGVGVGVGVIVGVGVAVESGSVFTLTGALSLVPCRAKMSPVMLTLVSSEAA
jgi:hypothetical protein